MSHLMEMDGLMESIDSTLLWASILSRRRRQCEVGWASFFDPTVEDRLQFFLNAVDGSIPTRGVEHQALHTLLDC